MELPYSIDELRDACHELIGVNGLPECYLRPIAFYGYGQLGVAARDNPVETVIMSWPWGAYLGDDGMANGIRGEDLELAADRPERDPARREGDRRLPELDARRDGGDPRRLRRGDPAHRRGHVADGSGENIFIVKNGTISTPSLSTSILPGITRDTIIQIAQDLGYTVEETDLIRSDLYLADEVFMCGTAAEVTPLKSVDDYELGVGPVTLEIQKAYLETVRGRERALGAVARPARPTRTPAA